MPGIPMSGTADAITFSISFWAALYSGLIYGIVTGIIVGLFVLSAQHKAGTRRFRHDLERDLATLREQLRFAIDRQGLIVSSEAASWCSRSATTVAELLEGQPLDLWRENLQHKKDFLCLLREFQLSYSNFTIASDKLDLQLHKSIRRHNASEGHCAANDDAYITYFLARINGMSDDSELLAVLDSPEGRLPLLNAGLNAALSEQLMVDCLSSYTTAKSKLDESIELLSRSLTRSDSKC